MYDAFKPIDSEHPIQWTPCYSPQFLSETAELWSNFYLKTSMSFENLHVANTFITDTDYSGHYFLAPYKNLPTTFTKN